jgi:hypothetical protein
MEIQSHLHLCMRWKFKLTFWEELTHLVPWAWPSIPVNLVFTLYTDNVHFYLTFQYNPVPMLACRDGHKIKFYLSQNFFSADNYKYLTVILKGNLLLKYILCIAVSHNLTQLPCLLLTYEYFIYRLQVCLLSICIPNFTCLAIYHTEHIKYNIFTQI